MKNLMQAHENWSEAGQMTAKHDLGGKHLQILVGIVMTVRHFFVF